MRILCVEDDRASLRLLCRTLDRGDHNDEVIGVESAAAACRRLAKGGIDVVITDMLLEDGDGIEVLEAARRAPAPAEVVVLTALDSLEVAVDAMHRGAWDYLPKPLDPRLVTEKIRCLRELLAVRAEAADGLYGRAVMEVDALETLRALEARVAACDRLLDELDEIAGSTDAPADTRIAILRRLLARRHESPVRC